jgi:hypothetical protein
MIKNGEFTPSDWKALFQARGRKAKIGPKETA